MATKTTFTIKLDTDFDIDLSQWDFPSHYTKEQKHKEILKYYFQKIGHSEIEITKKQPISLFEQIAQITKPKNEK